MSERPRVVVTGLGLISPLGNTVEASWQRMKAGEHGIVPLNPPFRYKDQDLIFVAAPVYNFTQDILGQKEIERRTHPSHLYGLAAAQEGLIQAGLWVNGRLEGVKPEDIGAKIGSGFAGAAEMIKVADALRNDEAMTKVYSLIIEPERVATIPSIAFLLRNSAHSSIAACATGAINVIEAYNRIVLGQAQVMVAGSTEAILQPEVFAIYNQVKALSTNRNPDSASIPFDNRREGFVVGAGAGILILENMEHAKARGAQVLAEIIGVGDSSDAGDATAPATEGQMRAMRKALDWARIDPAEVDYINAHGTSTKDGDRTELESIEGVFGDKSHNIPISSFKGHFAHMIGAAASAELAMAIKMMRAGVVLPTLGLQEPCRDDMNLIQTLQTRPTSIFMKNSFGFGGINAAIAVHMAA